MAFLENAEKKADFAEHTDVFDHVGLLVNQPPGRSGPPFIQSSDRRPVRRTFDRAADKH
jgi:hypothetical protein